MSNLLSNTFQYDDADHDLWHSGGFTPPDDDANDNICIPQRVPYHNKALKLVGLFHCSFMIDIAMPTNCSIPAHTRMSAIAVTESNEIEGAEKGIVPLRVVFCLKEKNQKKINLHRWFFNAFGPILQPNVCVLLDVGMRSGSSSIYHLWKAFDINSNVGGACGEIVAFKGKYGQTLLNPLSFVAPVSSFTSVAKHGAGADIFTANMYRAEDRILCWELVSRRSESWVLHYVKSAYAVTDTPDQVPELVSRRRRCHNGSFSAAIHSAVKFHYIYWTYTGRRTVSINRPVRHGMAEGPSGGKMDSYYVDGKLS
ncbi:chitin synthase-domain-containing protein [Lactarius deliciosus]|nr:chitin synthase-domain-containing protein [Lactarius deliciosus]